MDASPPLPSSAPPSMPKSGGGSGKKWVLWGCGGCLGLLVLTIVAGWFVVASIFGVIKGSDTYQTALTRAQNSPEVQAALGTPIKDGFSISGSVNMDNGKGTAQFTFPISGPNGEGTVTADATQMPGSAWEYSVLQVTIKGSGQVIDLRTSP